MLHPSSFNLASEDDDDWQGLTAGITSALMLTSTSASSSGQSTDNTLSATSTSGKFNAFSCTGSAISGEGGPKRQLILTYPRSKFEWLCFGLVGSSKFCIKEQLPGALSCGTGKHETSKCKALSNAFTLDMSLFNQEQVEVMNQKMLTTLEWSEVFECITIKAFPEWIPAGTIQEDEPFRVSSMDDQLMVPSYKPLGIPPPTHGDVVVFDFHPTLSFDSADSSIIVWGCH